MAYKEIACLIKKSGARAIGIAGKDDELLEGAKVREGGREEGRVRGRGWGGAEREPLALACLMAKRLKTTLTYHPSLPPSSFP